MDDWKKNESVMTSDYGEFSGLDEICSKAQLNAQKKLQSRVANMGGFLDDLLATGQSAAQKAAAQAAQSVVSSTTGRVNKILGVSNPPPPATQQSTVYMPPQVMAAPPTQIFSQTSFIPALDATTKRYLIWAGSGLGVLITGGIVYKVFFKGDPFAKAMAMMSMSKQSK